MKKHKTLVHTKIIMTIQERKTLLKKSQLKHFSRKSALQSGDVEIAYRRQVYYKAIFIVNINFKHGPKMLKGRHKTCNIKLKSHSSSSVRLHLGAEVL